MKRTAAISTPHRCACTRENRGGRNYLPGIALDLIAKAGIGLRCPAALRMGGHGGPLGTHFLDDIRVEDRGL